MNETKTLRHIRASVSVYGEYIIESIMNVAACRRAADAAIAQIFVDAVDINLNIWFENWLVHVRSVRSKVILIDKYYWILDSRAFFVLLAEIGRINWKPNIFVQTKGE